MAVLHGALLPLPVLQVVLAVVLRCATGKSRDPAQLSTKQTAHRRGTRRRSEKTADTWVSLSGFEHAVTKGVELLSSAESEYDYGVPVCSSQDFCAGRASVGKMKQDRLRHLYVKTQELSV